VNSADNMKHKLSGLSREYQESLRKHLKEGSQTSLQPAQGLGRQAMSIGLETLNLARIHEQALSLLGPPISSPRTRDAMVRRAGTFFAKAITPIEETHRTARETNIHLDQLHQKLRQRGADLAAANRRLKQEIVLRRSAEQSLRKSEQHYRQLLEQSQHMQEQLRLLSRQLLSAQEEERKRISRELHDVIAQTLTSINVRLTTLKREASLNTRGLERNIARTQELVERSVNIVHQFARELRPSVLDDLGLIPALHTFLKGFMEQTGIRVSLSAAAEVNTVDNDKRTVLFRVAQEALTNVARHAQASQAEVKIEKFDGVICMRINDNGKGFQEGGALHAKKNNRLGMLGMKERLEMVGGNITIESKPGKGTTIRAQIPFANGRARSLAEKSLIRSANAGV